MTPGSTGIGLMTLRAINAALGLLLSMALAAVFGVNRDVDALFVAMAVGVFLARDLSRVVRTAAVPCLVEHDAGAGHAGFPAMFQGAAVLLAAALASLVWLGAPWVVRITSPGFDPDAAQTAQRLLRLLAPSLLLFMLFGSAQAVFHARRRFFVPEIGETVWRLMALAALYGPGCWWGLEAYAQGLVIAALVQWLLVFAIGAFSGLPVVPTRWIPIRLGILRPLWLGAAVVLVSVAQLQVEGVLDRTALSFMAPGSLAIFSYAERLAHMAPLLLSTSLLTPWLPEMARIRARIRDPRRLAKHGSLFLAGLGALLALVIAWGAPDAVDLLLRRGKFDAASAAVAVRALRAFALGIPAIYCVQCLAGLYIVERDVKAMFRMGVVAMLTHGLGNVVLLGWGVTGIALSGSVSIWLVATYLWLCIRTVERVWFDWPRFAFAMAAAVGALYAIPWAALLPWAPARLVVGAFAAWAAYTAVLWPAIRRMQAYEKTATDPARTAD